MNITKYAAAIAIGLTCFAGQASATASALAQVNALQGSVAIDRGGVIAPVTGATTLNAGDRIVSMDGSAAKITFADGCTVDVKANAMATVGSASPCEASGLVNQSSPMSFNGFNGFWGAFSIFAIGAIIIAVYADNKNNDHDVLSP